MEAAESLFKCLEQVADPRKARGVRHPFPDPALDPAGLGLWSDHHGPHRPLRQIWPMLKEPLGFVRAPHATTISRTLAGVSPEQLQGALSGWVAQVVAEQELSASVDGKWAKQSEDTNGNPLVMVLARPQVVLGPVAGIGEASLGCCQLAQLFEGYPGLRLLTMDGGAGSVQGQPWTGLPGANQGGLMSPAFAGKTGWGRFLYPG